MNTDTERLVESVAKAIYTQWAFFDPGYVTWVEGGNSLRQKKARQLASQAVGEQAAALVQQNDSLESWRELADHVRLGVPVYPGRYTEPALRDVAKFIRDAQCALTRQGRDAARWQHAANEFADAATSGVEWLRNVRDGIASADTAIAAMLDNIEHARSTQPSTHPKEQS